MFIIVPDLLNMEYVYFVLQILLIAKSSAEEEICCAPRFVDALKSCPDFDNDKIKGDSIVMGFQGDEEAGGLRVSGAFDLLTDINDGYDVELTVSRLTDLGKEFMYSGSGNICGSLKNNDAPWTPLVINMNVTECPLVQGNYPIGQVVLNIDFAKDVMRHQFCGEYEVELAIMHNLKMVSCHLMSVEIYEMKK